MKEKIRTALSAYGMSGRIFHAPLISGHPGFELTAVLERNSKQAQEKYPLINSYPKLDQLLRDDAIELLVVNVPDALHFEFCQAGLEANKHLVVEKPFTLNSRDAKALIQIAHKRQLGLYVFQNRRWDSDFLTVKKLIQSGKLGQIVEFEAHYDRYRPTPPKNTWKEDGNSGTGLLHNLGAHLIDQALVLFGWPQALFADLRIMREGSGIIDYFHLILEYPSLRVHLKSSYLVRKPVAKYIIHGTKGSFIKSGSDPQEERLNKGWKANNPKIGRELSRDRGSLYLEDAGTGKQLIVSETGSYLEFYEAVFQELRGKKGEAVSAEEGLRVIQIIEAALKSQSQKKWIPLI